MRKRVAKKGTVYVGMSGGVDSSVSAALLKKAGYDVVGVFIKTWSPDWMPCTWPEERRDAMRVAAHLDIPLVTLDCTKEYKENVVDYMIAEYAAGRTPNPDVMCNREVKFGAFFDRAMAQGADFVATGHYAKTEMRGGVFHLLASADKEKDQTYFLWTLTQRHLSRTLFPIGGMKKSEVRALAKKFALPVAEKKDSQGLCFIGHIDIKEFLQRELKLQRGDVLDESGQVIGHHKGAAAYTIGEHCGGRVVVKKDVSTNTLTVASAKKIHEALDVREVIVCNVSWTSSEPKDLSQLSCRVRYRAPRVLCALEKRGNGEFVVRFGTSEFAVAPGQSIVFYDKSGKECLGGGIIS